MDDDGNKSDVILSVKDYEQLLEDLRELASIVTRYDEALISLADVMRRLEKSGFL